MGTYRIKQVIVMRTDLNMRKGKMAAQAAHSSLAFITKKLEFKDKDITFGNQFDVWLSDAEREWLNSSYAKICVGVDSLEALQHIMLKAEAAGLVCHFITDNGATEFHGVPTITCCAIGPDYSDKIDQVTGDLKLL